jgi:hypothetical protein
VTAFAARADIVLSSYPELWRNLTRIPVILDKSESGGRGLGAFFALLCVAHTLTELQDRNSAAHGQFVRLIGGMMRQEDSTSRRS